jgi:hypothetical protein
MTSKWYRNDNILTNLDNCATVNMYRNSVGDVIYSREIVFRDTNNSDEMLHGGESENIASAKWCESDKALLKSFKDIHKIVQSKCKISEFECKISESKKEIEELRQMLLQMINK